MGALVNMDGILELRKLAPELSDALGHFFETKCTDPRFHPHAFTVNEASRICAYTGADIYAVAVVQGTIMAYGMLRGWDEGYSIPSLGITVASECRGSGLAQLFMEYLHFNARLRGACSIRLKVYPDNVRAIALYRKLGYQFGDSLEKGQMVGTLPLSELVST